MSTVTPKLNLVKPATIEQFNLATYNNNLDKVDAEATAQALWNKDERILCFTSAAFPWSGSFTSWDAGTLSVDTSPVHSAQMSVPQPTFAGPGSVSGSLKFNEPGIYAATWWTGNGADPGSAGYRIITHGTWPGSPGIAESCFGQVQRNTGSNFWESLVPAPFFRVPTANLEIRFTGNQGNATTNTAKIRINQIGKL